MSTVSGVDSALETTAAVSGSEPGTRTSKAMLGFDRKSPRWITHSTGTERSPPRFSDVPCNSGCSDAFTLYTASMSSRAFIGDPVHWIDEPLSIVKRLLMICCSESMKLPSSIV